MLANAAMRKGYSVTPASFNSDKSSWGVIASASAKSTIVGWLAYICKRRGVTSPLPSFTKIDFTLTFCVKGI